MIMIFLPGKTPGKELLEKANWDTPQAIQNHFAAEDRRSKVEADKQREEEERQKREQEHKRQEDEKKKKLSDMKGVTGATDQRCIFTCFYQWQ